MDATYDRELIAEMLAAAAHGGIHLFAMDAVMGQIAALRAADNRDAAGVDSEEDAYVIERMGKMLAEIAVIVNGPEPDMTRWSYHDLPEKVRALKTAPAAVPAGEAVAYLDIGVGGYLDLGTEKDADELFKLPPGRHMLGIIGTYGVDGYKANPPAAEAHAPVQAAPQEGERRWPFVESPGEFAERLRVALTQFPLIGAVRNVLIENPPALAAHPSSCELGAVVSANRDSAGEGKGISASHKKHDGPCWRNSHADCGC